MHLSGGKTVSAVPILKKYQLTGWWTKVSLNLLSNIILNVRMKGLEIGSEMIDFGGGGYTYV